MSNAKEIPELVGELVDLSKEYLRQETVEPAKRLGRAAGLGFLAGLLLSLGALLLSVALLRFVIDLLPSSELWSAAGYGITTVALAAIAGLIMWGVTR